MILLPGYGFICPGSKQSEKLVAVNGSISAEIEKQPNLKIALQQISDHFNDLGRTFRQGNPENDRPFPCAFARADGVKYASRVVTSYGWDRIRGNCMTKVGLPGTKHQNMMKSKKLFRSMLQFATGLSSPEVGGKILKNVNFDALPRPWQKPYTNRVLYYDAKDTYHDCKVVRTVAFRIRGVWRIAAGFTNAPVGFRSALHERLSIHDIVSVNNITNVTESYPVTTQQCGANGSMVYGHFFAGDNGTAFATYSSGAAPWSDFLTSPIDENPATQSVLNDIDGNEMNVVEDSDTASNFAILLLPVILALIPLSLFQDVCPVVAILYIIVTDIFSVLPVAIKGVELLEMAKHRHHTTMSYIYGADRSAIIAAETWVSFCGLKPYVKQRGVILLTIAVTGMVAGLVLEFVTRARVSQLKKELYHVAENTDEDDDAANSDLEAILKRMQYSSASSGGGLLWQLEQAKIMKRNTESRRRKPWCSWSFQRKKTEDYAKSVEV